MITQTIIDGLREFDTALLANTLDYIGDTPQHLYYMGGSIQSQTPDLGPTVGVAVTCKLDSSTPEIPAHWDPYWEQMDRIAAMDLPVMWIVETVGSRPDHECVTGDGMAKLLFAAGCLGVVTNGYCRDIDGCKTVPFAVHARGTIGHHAPVRIIEVDTPVEVGGLTIYPGELIHTDKEGVIKISDAVAGELVEKAPVMRQFEHEAHMALRRTDLTVKEKQNAHKTSLERFGFGKKKAQI